MYRFFAKEISNQDEVCRNRLLKAENDQKVISKPIFQENLKAPPIDHWPTSVSQEILIQSWYYCLDFYWHEDEQDIFSFLRRQG